MVSLRLIWSRMNVCTFSQQELSCRRGSGAVVAAAVVAPLVVLAAGTPHRRALA